MTGDPTSPLQPGDRFLDLEVLERVGRGAFATVYRAHDTLLDRDVALKVFDPARISDSESGRRWVLREARMVAQLRNPHVVTLHRVHELPGGHWACEFEYVDGGDLRGRIDPDRSLDFEEAERVIRAVLSALSEAHAHGIVHGDVKPANVLQSRDGAVKLTDFGLGLFMQEVSLSSAGAPGPRGTPHYMGPEIVMGGPATPASDVWSVGVLLYRLLTGRLPFPQTSWDSLFLAIQNDPPAPLGADVPTRLANLALRCLAKDAGNRGTDARLVLERFLDPQRALAGAGGPAAPSLAGPASEPLVGREAALGTLRSHLEAVSGSEGRCVLLLGEAGIGKTALLQELARDATAAGHRCLETRLSALEGLRRPLLQVLDLASDVASAAIEHTLVRLAAERPLVVLLDDVHLGDREDLRMLASLVAALAEHPALVALAWRTRDPRSSDSSDGWVPGYRDLLSLPGVSRLDLEPLSDGAMRELVEHAAGTRSLPTALVERVIEASDGIPLYALALYRHLENAGEIARTESGVRFTPRWSSSEPPPLLRDMVARRLQGLTDDQRHLLETAAVSGGAFTGKALARLTDQPVLEVLRELQRLYRDRDLVAPLEHGFRFVHHLYREVIAAGLSPDLLRALHRAWAELLEEWSAEDPPVDPETLGWHWEQAGESDRSASPLREAGLVAARRGEQTRAWDLAERSGILANDASPDELRRNLDLLLSLQPSFASAEEADRVERLYARIADAADVLGDDVMRWRVIVKTSWSAYFRAGADKVDEEALQEAAESLPDGPARAEAWWMLGLLARNRGDAAAARSALGRADLIFEARGRSGDRAKVLGVLGSIHWRAGELAEAHELLQRGSQIHATTGKGVYWAISATLATLVGAQAGHRDGAPAALDAPIRTLERGGQEARAAHARVYQAQLLEGEGRTREALEVLERAERVLRTGVLGGALLMLLLERARYETTRGAMQGARMALAEAEKSAGRGAPGHRAALAVRRALLLAVEGSTTAAGEEAAHGLAVVATTHDRLDHARCLQEVVVLTALGVVPKGIELSLAELSSPPDDASPPFLGASARILRAFLGTDDITADAATCSEIARLCSETTFAWHPAEMRTLGRLFDVYAHLADGEADQVHSDLEAVLRQAREMDHVWLELRALRCACDAGLLTPDDPRVEEARHRIRDRNPGQADLVARALEHALGTDV